MKKRKQDKIMDRTRAAVAFLNASSSSERSKAFAFLSIFHPEMSLEKRLELTNSMSK
jgi:hypothetical protein